MYISIVIFVNQNEKTTGGKKLRSNEILTLYQDIRFIDKSKKNIKCNIYTFNNMSSDIKGPKDFLNK